MNNSISNSTHSRTSLTQLSQNWSASRFPSALRADANQGNPSVEASASVVEKRMSVVNLEAGKAKAASRCFTKTVSEAYPGNLGVGKRVTNANGCL